jgi:hypothetical protein
MPGGESPGWRFGVAQPDFPWLYSKQVTGPLTHWEIPLWWPLIVACLAATVGAWRLDSLARRRARLNCCPKCNYNRAGLAPGAVCPECGSAA